MFISWFKIYTKICSTIVLRYNIYNFFLPQEVEKYKGNVGRLAQAAEERRKNSNGREVVLSEPRLVREANRNWGIVDTEDIKETNRIKVFEIFRNFFMNS